MRRGILVAKIAILLFLCAAGPALVHLSSASADSRSLIVALAAPAAASLLLMCLCISVPELIPGERPLFPINVTFPILHGALTLLTVTLVSRVGVTIQRPPEQIAPMTVWLQPAVLGPTVLISAIALSGLVFLASRGDPVPDPGN